MKRVRGFHRRADTNHVEIKAAFLKFGCSVADLRLVGGGISDLLVGYRGLDRQVEVKRPRGPKATAEDRQPAQVAYAAAWQGYAPVVVRTVADVEQLVTQWARERVIAIGAGWAVIHEGVGGVTR